jgi:hypothetical protein
VSCVQTWFYFSRYPKVSMLHFFTCIHINNNFLFRMSGTLKHLYVLELHFVRARTIFLGCCDLGVRQCTSGFDIAHWRVLCSSSALQKFKRCAVYHYLITNFGNFAALDDMVWCDSFCLAYSSLKLNIGVNNDKGAFLCVSKIFQPRLRSAAAYSS